MGGRRRLEGWKGERLEGGEEGWVGKKEVGGGDESWIGGSKVGWEEARS